MLKTYDYFVFPLLEERKGTTSHFVQKTLKTPELCFSAVQCYGLALKYVPEECKTPEICLAAVQNDEPYYDDELDDDGESESPPAFVPEAFKTSALCLAAVERNDMALKYVPEALKKEIVAAVIQAEAESSTYGLSDSHG